MVTCVKIRAEWFLLLEIEVVIDENRGQVSVITRTIAANNPLAGLVLPSVMIGVNEAQSRYRYEEYGSGSFQTEERLL
jgi:hypothetical protein